jgi:pilus assembly protein FimV
MHKKQLRTLVTVIALAAISAEAAAIGLRGTTASTVLGQTLDHVVTVRLDAGEALAPECVKAEVMIGERRVPSDAVRTQLEGQGMELKLRVLTTVAVDEPIVSVAVSAGCPTRLSRRFVLFADPLPVSVPSAAVPLSPIVADAGGAGRGDSPTPAAAPVPAAAASTAAAAPRQTAGPAARPAARQASTSPRKRVRRPRKPETATATAAPATAAARPRLRLDAADPVLTTPQQTADAIEAAASAAAAVAGAQATTLANAAAAERIAALEKAIEKLRAESAADRESLLVLRRRAAEGDAAATWMPLLLGLLAVLATLALWMGLKLRRLQHEKQMAWWTASAGPQAAAAAAAAASAAGAPSTVSVPSVPPRADPVSAAALAAGPISGGYSTTRPGTLGPVFSADPITEAPPMPMERTQALPVGWRDDAEPSRDVSIEELIDLEQQAEFFIVLGQEDAAIDLLVDHLRNTGGGSPMPYLKLLEIYRRRGEREAYDRTRARFNHRFNAYAPDWDADSHDGRSLEDYPSIVARLQMAWPTPIDAMAELESLLFRKDRGELFDMPAYRDVLFLYALARDLLDREPIDSGSVDVLLPINDGDEFTQPMSLDELPSKLDSGMVALDNQPTVPVDLDVTQPGMPDSLFSEPTEPGNRRRR